MKIVILLTIYFLRITSCVEWRDGEFYNISLKGLNPTPKNSEIYSSHINLTSISTIAILITDISPSTGFLIIQAHSYKDNLTLSYRRNLDVRYHVNGTNVGLIIETKNPTPLYIINSNFFNLDMYLSIHSYYKNAPVPGGCNMEFNIIDPPFLRLWYDNNLIRVDASQARTSIDGDCDVGSVNVTHDFYRMFFSEWDHSVEEYFKNLNKMLTVENILKYGSHVPEITAYAQMRRYFSVYPGTGSFYVVVATSYDMSAAYVPIHTYGCDNCSSSYLGVLYVVLAFILGFLLNFMGFSLHSFQSHIFGLLLLLLFTYTLINFFEDSLGSIAIFYGIAFLLFLLCTKFIRWCNMPLPAMFILSFLISSAFYNSVPEGYLGSDYYFWLLSFGVVFSITLLPLFHYGYNISCSIVGSFCLIILFDALMGSYIRYIVINVLRRITVTNFNVAIIKMPFQWRDITVTIIWVILCLVSILLHYLFSKNGYNYSPTVITGIFSIESLFSVSPEAVPFFGAGASHNYGT